MILIIMLLFDLYDSCKRELIVSGFPPRGNDVNSAFIVIPAEAGIQVLVLFESEHILEKRYNSTNT
jgi:hypothetical protein